MNLESKQQPSETPNPGGLESRQPSVKLFLGEALFRFSKLLAVLLPPAMLVALGRRVGRWTSYICPREMSFAISQIRFALKIADPEDAKLIARQSFASLGESLCEILLFEKLLIKKPAAAGTDVTDTPTFEHLDATGTEVVTDLLRAGKPAIALSAHFGCVELLAGYFVSIGAKMSVATRVPHYSGMAELFRSHREKFNIETLWKGDTRSAMKMVRRLKDGGVVAGLMDQDMDEENIFSLFFGLPCATPARLVRVAIKYDLPIITSFLVRTGPLSHRIVTENLDWKSRETSITEPKLSDEELQAWILDEYHRRLETLIRAHPEQWVWWHRRWRRRPGEDQTAPRSSSLYLQWLDGLTEERLKE